MPLPDNDFFSTAAQVIITAVLVFAVESRTVRDPDTVSPLALQSAAGFMVLSLGGLAGCFDALATGPSRSNVVMATAALIASAGLVIVPAFAGRSSKPPVRATVRGRKQSFISAAILLVAMLSLLAVVDMFLVPDFDGR